MIPVCRECHQESIHSDACMHVTIEERHAVLPEDEVVPDHTPPQPYCPGPGVACRYADEIGIGGHRCPADVCYYRTESL